MAIQIKAWIKALRIRTLPLAISGIVVGNAVAYFYGAYDAFILKMSLYTALLLQILSNLANDYGDFQKGTDNENRVGPERALQSGAIEPRDMKTAMMVVGFFAFICGSLLVYYGLSEAKPLAGLFFIGIGIISIVAAVFYTVGKNAYGYKGLGDVMVFLFFGITAVAGAFYLQFKDILWQVLLPAGAIGFFSAGVLNMNNMRDVVNDEACGKITIPVRLGFTRSKIYHSFLMLAGVGCATVFQCMYLPPYMAWHLAGLGIVCVHLIIVWRITDEKKFDGQLKLNVLATLLYAICISIALFNK
jgi:1,4-dihydroxy-2-naphthoate octaprenyltransferase